MREEEKKRRVRPKESAIYCEQKKTKASFYEGHRRVGGCLKRKKQLTAAAYRSRYIPPGGT